MRNPSYLTTSRHGIAYLRWPIPPALHPQGKATDIKVSLRTRDKREALRRSRHLSVLAETLIQKAVMGGMRYDEIRELVRLHFKNLLDVRRETINGSGRLSETDLAALSSSQLVAEAPSGHEAYPGHRKARDDSLRRFQELYGLSFGLESREHQQLEAEFWRGYQSYLGKVQEYDASLDKFELDHPPRATNQTTSTQTVASSATLREVVDGYMKDGQLGRQWAAKTLVEKGAQLDLLFEIVGHDAEVTSVTPEIARRVKETVIRYPKNRNKNALTRGKSLDEVLELKGVQTISTKTINEYLGAYSALFGWAKRNGYVTDNVFAGLKVSTKRDSGSVQRDAFSDAECGLMIGELLSNRYGLVRKDHQRWGPLIAMYTGARLGEIAQLHVADIYQKDDVWCFDLNDEGDKNLKNRGSKRLVPMHSRLIKIGLLQYVETMRLRRVERLFPELSYCPKNGWGRSLGRWFNDRFLMKLEIKRPELVFHSLRHTVITRLSQLDVPDTIIKAIVGHTQDGITHTVYFKQGYKVKQLQSAVETLDFKTK